jgi:hypothetical protein
MPTCRIRESSVYCRSKKVDVEVHSDMTTYFLITTKKVPALYTLSGLYSYIYCLIDGFRTVSDIKKDLVGWQKFEANIKPFTSADLQTILEEFLSFGLIASKTRKKA